MEGYSGYRVSVRLVREGRSVYEPITIAQPREAYEFLREISRYDREVLYSIMLDATNHVIGCEEASRGSLNTTRTHPREIYKSALLANACGIILGHNHPSGALEPSMEDVDFTRAIGRAGELLGVSLYDHIIVTDHGYTSLKERGLL
jgi:DNA repair protein RadC